MIEYVLTQFMDMILWLLRLIWADAEEFRTPQMLFLLLVVPVYLIWYYWWYDDRRLIVQISYDPDKIAPGRAKLGFLRVLPQILNIFAMILMVVALARPIKSRTIEQRSSEGIDIMMVLDVSGSMEINDFKPNRLEVAKETASRFIEGRSFDRIGMVVFAEDALSFAPLTLDYSLLKEQIASINSDMMPKEGTALGSAISVAVNRLRESNTPSKVMILITDGASNRGQVDPITAAELAKRYKIKIYPIGVGKKEFQQNTAFGSQTIQSDLDEPTMKQIAEITGGQFFRSTDKRSLQSIFDNISKMEKVEVQESKYKEENDLYGPILFIGLIVFFGNLLLMITFVHNPLEG
jgi:Ca-activated chloride channel homolog